MASMCYYKLNKFSKNEQKTKKKNMNNTKTSFDTT